MCSKPIGILRCEGCQKLFCRSDLNEHRNELSNQLDGLTVEHDAFQHTLNQATADSRTQGLIRRIDAWEKESKLKIRQAADEARRQIEIHAVRNAKEISTRFREMADRLQQARKEDAFDERDLKRWTEQLEQLKENFVSPSSVAVEEEQGTFIAKIQVKDVEVLGKRFDQVLYGFAVVDDGGLAVVCNYYNNHGAQVRGKGEYSGGLHEIQLKIENYADGFLFFGINSKSTAMQNNSCTSMSSYGWAAGANNTVYIHGQGSNNYKGYVSDFRVNDIIELELDCYRRLIRMRNHRSNKQHELPIDLDKCPFPWVLHLNLGSYGDRLRIVL
ncbi:unnamed protein product [Didymodactylos carnosus]|uniref:Uncharacterized protein n=1 Tax=Didymodactylos carnosus TaxID=1234261 RepID=A0A815DD57_9BILA|nr:unnamed protein product [Didymodactylos carnosus]CAF1296324.1 unnamed protein product [Didymodactylos carnosus]CAF4087925.1 unnamed protein product [Didymodactylos carnosus]CAF4111335.1 unnamed protein product [Didymodactylos carnosus]